MNFKKRSTATYVGANMGHPSCRLRFVYPARLVEGHVRTCGGSGRTAGPSATLRSGRDDKGEGECLPGHLFMGSRGYAQICPSLSQNLSVAPIYTLSSLPKRTRISCHAAVDISAFAPFRKEGRMKFNSTNPNRKFRGSEVEGPAASPISQQTCWEIGSTTELYFCACSKRLLISSQLTVPHHAAR
jgi:hypothetical protein